MAATKRVVDLTDVKEGGVFRPKQRPEGDYKAKIVKADDHTPKAEDAVPGWVLTIMVDGDARATYPYYLNPAKKQAWKIGSICRAAGLNVGNKRINFDPNRLVGKSIGIALADDEYEGRVKSAIDDVFPTSEIQANADEGVDTDADDDEGVDVPDDDEPVEDDTEEYEDEEPEPEPVKPAPRKRAARPKPAPEPEPEEDDDDDDEPEEEPAPAPAPRKRRPAARPAPEPDPEDDEDDEEPAPAPKRTTAPKRRAKPTPTPVEDDEDLDLDDLDD